MSAFSLARLQEDLSGGRLTPAAADEYRAAFSLLNLGQIRHLCGRLGVDDSADRAGALSALDARLSAATFDGAFPAAAGGPAGPTTATVGAVGEDEANPPPPPEKELLPPKATPPAAAAEKGGKSPGSTHGSLTSPGRGGKASYESPGSGGSESMPLWNEGGSSPGKGGKCGASYEDGPAAAAGPGEPAPADKVPDPVKTAAGPGEVLGGKGGKAGKQVWRGFWRGAVAPAGKPPCRACKTPAEMALDVGGDGDDDSGPLTPEHVLAEAGKNGVTDAGAAQTLAAQVAVDPGITHTKIHALYDMTRHLAAGGGMTQGEAARKAAGYASVQALQGAATAGDPLAARVLARVPAEHAAGGDPDYWGGVVLAGGRPRTRLGVLAEFTAAGVPGAYTDAYLSEAAPFDRAGNWVSVPGEAGPVRFCVGPTGLVTKGPLGLLGRPAEGAVARAYRPLVRATARGAHAAHAATFFNPDQPRDGGRFASGGGGGGEADDYFARRAKREKDAAKDHEYAQKVASGEVQDHAEKLQKQIMVDRAKEAAGERAAGRKPGLIGRLLGKVTGGKAAAFAVLPAAPATTGLAAALAAGLGGSRLETLAALAGRPAPGGLDPAYFWDELVYGPAGKATRLWAMADHLDAGATPDAAFALAAGAAFAEPPAAWLPPAAEFEHDGGTPDKEMPCNWVTFQGMNMCIGHDGNILAGPKHLIGKSPKSAMRAEDYHKVDAVASAAKAHHKAKQQKAADEKAAGEKAAAAGGRGDSPGDGHGASHGDLHAHGHSAGQRVTHYAEHAEKAVHFLLHPGMEMAGMIASNVLGGRYKKIKEKIHHLEGKIRKRYGEPVGTAILVAGIGGAFGASSIAAPLAAVPGMHLVGALPVIAAAEAVKQGGRAVKALGSGLARGLDKAGGAAKAIGRLFTGAKRPEAVPDKPQRSKAHEKRLRQQADKKKKAKAEFAAALAAFPACPAAAPAPWEAAWDLTASAWPGSAALFAAGDDAPPAGPACDVPNSVIVAEGKKFAAAVQKHWARLLKGADLKGLAAAMKKAHAAKGDKGDAE